MIAALAHRGIVDGVRDRQNAGFFGISRGGVYIFLQLFMKYDTLWVLLVSSPYLLVKDQLVMRTFIITTSWDAPQAYAFTNRDFLTHSGEWDKKADYGFDLVKRQSGAVGIRGEAQ